MKSRLSQMGPAKLSHQKNLADTEQAMFSLRLSADRQAKTARSLIHCVRVWKVMGRPRVNDSDKRQVQVNIRLTVDENSKVIEFASACGLSPANWIRTKIFTGKFPIVKMSSIDSSTYLELKKIGVNLNQVTHKINAGEFPREYLDQQLELANLLKKIINLLTHDRQPDQGQRL